MDKLLTKLQNVGCNKLRISNTQLLGYLKKHYPYFKLYASTSFEYCQLKQYNIFFEMFPEIVEIVPSFDCNKNFKLIKNLKNSHPNIDIELMVNEGCLSGCPLRTHHNFTTLCDFYTENHTFYSLCNPNLIYPWEINEYSKIGINKFKLVGRNSPTFIKTGNKNSYEVYLKGVDNYSLIENEPYGYLNNYYFNLITLNHLTLS